MNDHIPQEGEASTIDRDPDFDLALLRVSVSRVKQVVEWEQSKGQVAIVNPSLVGH